MGLTAEQLNELHQIRKFGSSQAKSPNLKTMELGNLTSQLADDAIATQNYSTMAEMKPVIKDGIKSTLLERIKSLGSGKAGDFTVSQRGQGGTALVPALAQMALVYGAEKALSVPEVGVGSDTLPPELQIEKNLTNEAYKKLKIQQMLSNK